jgi:predicted peptidase
MLQAIAAVVLASGATVSAAPPRVQTGFLFCDLTMAEKRYPYVVYVPRNYEPNRKWPVILFLHGAGECGSDGQKQVLQGIGSAILQDASRWPFIVVMPQKPEVRDAWEDHDAAVIAMLDAVIREYAIDTSRQYLTGLSQGGHGTWAIGARHADRWAAIAPICGYGDPEAIAPRLKDMPIWCFHGDADPAVPLAQSEKMVEAIKAAGGSPKLTVYPGVGHNSWDKAYREEPLGEWFLEHTKAPVAKKK